MIDTTLDFQKAVTTLQSGNTSEALATLNRLAAEGFGHADSMLGGIYEYGKNEVPKNHAKAIEHYELAINSVGAVESWLGLGRVLLNGDPELRNYSRAFECFFAVCEDADDPRAWLHLASMHLEGLGVARDLKAARECYERALQLGNVFGYTGLSRVEHAEGNHVRGLKYRLIAFAKTLSVLLKNPRDPAIQGW